MQHAKKILSSVNLGMRAIGLPALYQEEVGGQIHALAMVR
jgi:hypothetical protein